jgi:hypothetical protein
VVSMVPNPNLVASGSASSSSPMSAPPAPTASSSGSDSSGYSSSPSYNQYSNPPAAYNQYTAPPAQYTPPPQTSAMPYESFMGGGYKSMDCGYGYNKGSDGSCTSTESWVRISHLKIPSAMQFMRSIYLVVHHGLLSDVPDVSVVSTTLKCH